MTEVWRVTPVGNVAVANEAFYHQTDLLPQPLRYNNQKNCYLIVFQTLSRGKLLIQSAR